MTFKTLTIVYDDCCADQGDEIDLAEYLENEFNNRGLVAYIEQRGATTIEALQLIGPESRQCLLCGQRIDDGRPCGCGARV